MRTRSESTKSRRLRGNMGYVSWVGAWVRGLRGSNFYVGCVSYVGQNIFYVCHNFYVGCVGKTFLRGSIFFKMVKIFCLSQNFLRGLRFLHGSFFWVGGKVVGNGSKKYLD